jgi:AAA+ ATPase superfamily predicted ATPase
MRFIGRQREIDLLDDAFAAREAAFIPIYGRRRIGKSELILRFMRKAPGLYFLGKTAPAALQLRELMREAARALGEPLLAETSPEGYRQAFELITSRLPADRRFVLALDEFQWMAQASPELPSVLQELWDRKWKRSGRILLILCGSFIGFMEREVLGRNSPLFGRRTAQVKLGPLSHLEAAEFQPDASLADRARTYFICGGVPLYLEMFRPGRSIEQNIEQVILDEHSPLFREPDFLLREELREVDSYYAVLLALAGGSAVHREVASRTHIAERSLGYYLRQLEELGYVEKKYPLTEKKPGARSVRYGMSDPLLRFWFRFVFPNLSFLQQQGASRTFRELIRPEIDGYFGGCFERLCRDALPWIYRRERVSAAYRVGQYWDRDVQIDLVGLRDDAVTDLGECKWGSYGGRKKMLAELEAKRRSYPNARGATLIRRAFVRTLPRGADTDDPTLRWHDLDDLYARP